jgi:hypothetical protein
VPTTIPDIAPNVNPIFKINPIIIIIKLEMKKPPFKEKPLQLKAAIAEDVAEVIHCLHYGLISATNLLLDDIKSRALLTDEKIQQKTLKFSEQVLFQFAYDPNHAVSKEVETAALDLLDELGYKPERLFNYGKAS